MAGERARFWVVAAGPSDGIAFHIIGTVFDTATTTCATPRPARTAWYR